MKKKAKKKSMLVLRIARPPPLSAYFLDSDVFSDSDVDSFTSASAASLALNLARLS